MKKPSAAQAWVLRHLLRHGGRIVATRYGAHLTNTTVALQRPTFSAIRSAGWIEPEKVTAGVETVWRISDAGSNACDGTGAKP